MHSTQKIFTNYVVRQKGEKTTFKGKISFKWHEKVGIVGLYLIPAWILYYIPTPSTILIIGKIVAMIVLFIFVKKLIDKMFHFSLFTLDKASLSSHMDKFHARVADIRDISIVEEAAVESDSGEMQYRLKFVLQDGEKTSAFAFTSYDVAEALVKDIKKFL